MWALDLTVFVLTRAVLGVWGVWGVCVGGLNATLRQTLHF